MTDEELCGWLRSMLPASGFAPTENWAPWLGADRIEELDRHLTLSGKMGKALSERIEALEAENGRLRGALREISETPNAGWMIARAALGEKQ